MSAAITPADSRLRRRAQALAQLYASGQITLDQLRAEMTQELRLAVTAAILAGTGTRENAAVREAIQRGIQREIGELTRLITLLENRPDMAQAELQRRLEAFADGLDDYQAEGERLTQDDRNPLVPLVVGTGIAEIIRQLLQGRDTTRVTLPRLDSGQIVALTDDLRAQMDALSDAMSNGELLADDWQERMRRLITQTHLQYYQATRGALTDADRARLEARLRAQFDFLDGFRADVEAGTLTPEQLKRRARMYLDSAKSSLQEGAAAALGMPPLPCYPGERSECRYNCRCSWRIVTLDESGAWDCYWSITAGEVCPNCVARASEWNPLQIRNGVIQPYSSAGLFV